ncbi:MAG TPA: histidine kinase [Solirubrobacteraceae bacterium]|nr:histidine kinase [Solirubrobacteraceae bacterium]
MSGLRRALVALVVAGLALGLAALALATTSDREDDSVAWIVLALTLGWGFAGAGIFAWWRRPENRIGPLMTLVGFMWFLGALGSADTAWAYTLGLLVGALWIGALVHMLIAFPTGRVEPGVERGVVILGWSTSIVLPFLAALVTARPNGCRDCPDNLLLAWDSDTASSVVEGTGLVASVVLLVGLGVVLIRRWRGFGKVQRRALAPVVWTAAAVAVVGIASVLPIAFGADEVSHVVDAVLIVLITALPFAFLVGLMRSSLSRAGAVSALFERLGGVSARDALAEALGDHSLALAYWLPDSGRYVDARGQTVALPTSDEDRAVTAIERDGAPVAAIVHDPALLDDRELVRTAGAAAALALENERLAAELRARYDDLRAASARLVAAGDAARRRIERDLHDGAQQRLVSLSVTLNLARRHAEPGSQTASLLDSAMGELTAGLSELRELARGIHPAVLTERGLDPALAGLAARAPLPVTISAPLDARLPPAVEAAAYFVVMESLTNVAKYASASGAEVTIKQENGDVVIDVADDGVGGADPAIGTGLMGLADRVTALGGRLEVESPPGGGTIVRAEMPAAGFERTLGSAIPASQKEP